MSVGGRYILPRFVLVVLVLVTVLNEEDSYRILSWLEKQQRKGLVKICCQTSADTTKNEVVKDNDRRQ